MINLKQFPTWVSLYSVVIICSIGRSSLYQEIVGSGIPVISTSMMTRSPFLTTCAWSLRPKTGGKIDSSEEKSRKFINILFKKLWGWTDSKAFQVWWKIISEFRRFLTFKKWKLKKSFKRKKLPKLSVVLQRQKFQNMKKLSKLWICQKLFKLSKAFKISKAFKFSKAFWGFRFSQAF